MHRHVFAQNTDFDGLLLKNRNLSEHVTNRKVVDNGLYYLNMHFQPHRGKSTRENGQKPSKMAKKWPKNGFLTSKMNFSEHVTNRKVVDNGLFYLNMHFQPNPWQNF